MARKKQGHERKVVPMAGARALSLDRLYRQYAGWLSRALSARMRSTPVEVDDLVQETYERASNYEAEVRHPKAFLMSIAVNLARDHMRRNVVRGGLAADANAADQASWQTEDPHQLLQLKQIVLDLPPIYRDVFVLNRFTGLTYEEIARHTGISVKTVEWRMSKALAMCMARMQD